MTESNPQTVSFTTRITYGFSENRGPLTREESFEGAEAFEEMLSFFRKERKRRAKKDRATEGKYRMVLTDLGRKRVKENPIHHNLEEAVNGTWFSL